ncbi:hypothetical protein [Rhodobacteraceae bacterium DSL-40]|uniref:hypothetical protein n=1 Tax=Amaricoccus sp. B4 TaxID=3368557 RepID=UPI000DAF3E63
MALRLTGLFGAMLLLAACGDTVGERAATGGVGGAVVGTAVGGPIVGTAAGATIGAVTAD